MAHVTTAGRTKPVKNLGWLLRHSREAQRIVMTELPNDQAYLQVWGQTRRGAELGAQWRYETRWACQELCREFCQLRRFAHCSIAIQQAKPEEN